MSDDEQDLQTAILAGLDQAREAVLGGRGTDAWQYVPYNRLKQMAELTVELTEMLTAHEILVLGAYLASSAKTQLTA